MYSTAEYLYTSTRIQCSSTMPVNILMGACRTDTSDLATMAHSEITILYKHPTACWETLTVIPEAAVVGAVEVP